MCFQMTKHAQFETLNEHANYIIVLFRLIALNLNLNLQDHKKYYYIGLQ